MAAILGATLGRVKALLYSIHRPPALLDDSTPGMAAEKPVTMACHQCGRSLAGAADVAWECECGIRVCGDPDCFAECFKLVASGEATRCLTCGLLT
jgi:hypothetical protein